MFGLIKKKEQEKQYAPKTQEEIANMPPEQVKKMFYLSPERMIASMKRINNGKAWDSLARNSKDKLELQIFYPPIHFKKLKNRAKFCL